MDAVAHLHNKYNDTRALCFKSHSATTVTCPMCPLCCHNPTERKFSGTTEYICHVPHVHHVAPWP